MASLNIAVLGSPCDHEAGLLGESVPPQTKIFINNITVATFGTPAAPDLICYDPDNEDPRHCAPAAITGSDKVFINNIGVHRQAGLRECGAVTIADGLNPKVFAG
jgi:hypothetical protein